MIHLPNHKPVPAKAPTATFQGEKDLFHFDVSCVLVKRADIWALPKGAPWKDSADQWRVTVTQREYGNKIEMDYWTGHGHRQFPGKDIANPRTKPWYELSRTVEPDAKGILYSLAMDYSSFRDLPADEGKALDQLAEESGCTKPSEALDLLRGLRQSADQLRQLLRNTGILPDEFADHEWDA